MLFDPSWNSPSSTTNCNHKTINYEDVPPLKCLFYAEFDAVAGPKIVYQIPDDGEEQTTISKETFDSLSGFFITKPELLDKFIKVNTTKLKIMGNPVVIEHKRYARNALIFNLCFVVDNVSHVDCLYEPLVRKMAHYLVGLERESEYLTNETTRHELKTLMRRIYDDLNCRKECSIEVNDKTRIHLKIMPKVYPPPASVTPYDVPILRRPYPEKYLGRLDVVSQKCLPCITGFAPVCQISELVQIDKAVVSRCIENLFYHGLVSIVPLFQYSNSYSLTSTIRELYKSDDAGKRQFASAVSLQQAIPAKFCDIFRLLCHIQPSLSVKDWCLRHNPRGYGVDERKLIQLAVYRGYLRKLTVYPVSASKLIQDRTGNDEENMSVDSESTLDGSKTVDELANVWCQRPSDTLKRLEVNPDILLLWK